MSDNEYLCKGGKWELFEDGSVWAGVMSAWRPPPAQTPRPPHLAR